MKLVDVNVLLYAVNADAREHDLAKIWVESALSGDEPVAFAWAVILGFLRLATRAGVFAKPLQSIDAFKVVESWLGAQNARIVHPAERHFTILRALLEKSGTATNLVTDAHLAALAIEHGAELISFDRDFAQFADLRLITLAL